MTRIRRLLAEMEPVLPGEIENATALELLRQWAGIEPAAAIEFAATRENFHGRAALPVELFLHWLERNPADAMAWLRLLPAGSLRSRLLPSVVAILAQHHPTEALAMSASLSGEDRRTALAAVFVEWSSNDPRAAAEHALALPQPAERNAALRAVLGKWMDSDLGAAVAWAKTAPPDPAPDSFEVLPPVQAVVIEKWAAIAPAEAASHVLATTNAAGRISLLKTIATQWAGADAPTALRFASSIADETDRNVMTRGVLVAVAEKDARAAAELALSSTGPGPGDDNLGFMIEQWQARDPHALTDWATAVVQRGDGAGLDSLVRSWATADVRSVETWISGLGAGDGHDRACLALIEFLAARDKQRALKWVDAIANPELRRVGLQRFGKG